MDLKIDFSIQIEEMRGFFHKDKTRDVNFRKSCLQALHTQISARQKDIECALYDDLGKPAAEAWLSEIGIVLSDLRYAERKLSKWSKPRLTWPDITTFPALARVYPEPFGVILIFSPWNYPFQLSLLPLVAAISAGNCAVLKPSRQSPHTGELLKELISSVFDEKHCSVITDLPSDTDQEATANALLQEQFDFIFYTGSSRVGHIVMQSASRYLTPMCLELGGQSPVLVTKDANLPLAAKRIAWGKILNAGQTCVAPDHIWADNAIKQELKALIEHQFNAMLVPSALESPNYARIVSPHAFARLVQLAEACGISLQKNEKTLKIAPAIFFATPESPALADEIFGPLLPLLGYDHLEEAIEHITSRPKPLACYIFTDSRSIAQKLLHHISFGGGCINDVVLQASSHNLPFGGVGKSGMGRYHGKAGFDLFSNLKGVVHQFSKFDLPLRYPPYGQRQFQWLKRILH